MKGGGVFLEPPVEGNSVYLITFICLQIFLKRDNQGGGRARKIL